MLTILDKLIYIFSPSPIHFEVKDEALILKKVNPDLAAIHCAIIVLPVPGANKRKMLLNRLRGLQNHALLA